MNKTLQSRLCAELARHNITTIDAENVFLQFSPAKQEDRKQKRLLYL